MVLEKRNRRSNGLLWAGLAMIGAALVLTFVTSFYARHAGGYSGQGRMMGRATAPPLRTACTVKGHKRDGRPDDPCDGRR